MDDQTDAQIAPSGSFGSTLYINCDNPMMSAQMKQIVCTDNGYGPGVLGPDGVENHAGLQVFRRNVEGGGRQDLLSHQSIRLTGGLKGDLGAGWSYDLSGLYAHTRVPESYINDFNATRLQEALFVEGDPNDPSTWACTSGNPNCVPWDIFNPGGVTPAAVAYLNLPMLSNGSAKTEMVLGTLNADLGKAGLQFPGAAEGLSLALGADYRKEFIDFQTDLAYQTGIGAGQGSTTPSVTGYYDVKELFAELLIPFVQGAKGVQDLSLNLGYRYSDYNVNGVHPTYKAEATYAPGPSFKFRAGYNRATRAPNVVELYQPQRLVLGGSNDPCTNEEGDTPQFTLEQCMRTGVTPEQYGHLAPSTAGQYNTWSGGNPALEPETADTTTFGLVFTPAGTSLSIALDYFDIQLDETISTLGFDDIVSQCGLTGDPALCSLIHRDHFGSLWRLQSTQEGFVDTLNDNVGKKEAEGIDLNASYTLPAGNTFFSFTLQGTYMMTAYTNTGLYEYDCVGWTGNKCNNPYLPSVNMQPEWRHLFRVSWQTGMTVLTLGWRYLGPVKAEQASDQPALAAPEQIDLLKLNEAYEYAAWNWFDLALGLQLAKGIQFNFGINNILDKMPPRGPAARPTTTRRASTARTIPTAGTSTPASSSRSSRPATRGNGSGPFGGRSFFMVSVFFVAAAQQRVDLGRVPALQGVGRGHLLRLDQPALGRPLVPLSQVTRTQQEVELVLLRPRVDRVPEVADGRIEVLRRIRLTGELEPIVRVLPAVVDHLLPVRGRPLPLAHQLVEPCQIAQGDEIRPVGLHGLQVRGLGMGGMAGSQVQRTQVGPGRRELALAVCDGLAEARECRRGITRQHALHADVVVVMGQRPRVGDPPHLVAGLEIGDVEVHDARSRLLQVHVDVDVLVQDVGVLVQGPVGRDIHLLELDLQPRVTRHRHEHA
jgi:outer membrane receptor protein involved in Fe transport